MKYCTHCGKEVNDNAVVCIHCGCSLNKNSEGESKTGLGALLGFLLGLIGLIIGLCLYPNNIFSYIENLLRLGIIEIPPVVHLKDETLYHSLENHVEILGIKKHYENQGQKVVCKRKLFTITSFGKNFIQSCVV